jgi:phosphotransferase system enzyme I (PtsI)
MRRVALEGIGASQGVAIGQVYLLDRRRRRYPRHHVEKENRDAEVERLSRAVAEASVSLGQMKSRLIDDGHAEHVTILDAHQLMLQDPTLFEAAKKRITDESRCAEWALRSAVKEIKGHFSALGDDYFRERRSDIDFVGERIFNALMGATPQSTDLVPNEAVVIAHDLSPTDALSLLKKNVRAFVTEVGGKTSHTAIVARSLEIPAVVGCKGILEAAGNRDEIVVDGTDGKVVLHPSQRALSRARVRAKKKARLDEEFLEEATLPAITPDGHSVSLLANIELDDEVHAAVAHGAEGVGLYRTEFLYVNRSTLPTEAEHTEAYRRVIDALGPERKTVLRTFDLGGDKMALSVKIPKEDNPALGLRATRLGLSQPHLLRRQLRAMARAAIPDRTAILLPMIASVNELRRVREMLSEEMDTLERQGVPVWREIPVGAMIELPAAVWIADKLAEEADFFSVGTNDLMQFSLAIGRGNEHVAYLYHPLCLANLRALKHVIDAGHAANIPVGLCGEMGANPLFTPICIALGFSSLSMPANLIPRVKFVLRRFPHAEAVDLLERCLRANDTAAIETLVRTDLAARFPDLFDFQAEK